ncbi:MAG: tRNA (adenosine(37)-N6)-threonylcarbamoyltransferase complex ATPase subunit type 1 TsaE [Clostridia bacterium]|nr:tRNA (adenosine(37)-N6)-threonylcarbamoyltransferase complex ATPase subunit type 1 TsaE [Clostridia bacterium]
MVRVHCKHEQETEQTAAAFSAFIKCGDALLLSGEMGTGKSVFTRALARALGIDGPIPSPTFTILLIHDGPNGKLYHFDLYRLENEDELYEMGLNEMIPPDDGIAVVEWPEICASAMPDKAVRICLEYDGDDPERRILSIDLVDEQADEALRARLTGLGIETE